MSSVAPKDIPVVILAGGRGTRLMEETRYVPKPMVTVGGKPIIHHIMSYYSSFGFRTFIICLGYKGDVIKDYFINLPKHVSDVIVHGTKTTPQFIHGDENEWEVKLIETGANSLTGTRVQRVAKYIDAPHFCLTYGDGVCDVDLGTELETHLEHGKIGTVAAVHPPSRFGNLNILQDGTVKSFLEKQPLEHDYINGGFFMFKREMLDRLDPKGNYSFESDPLHNLAAEGELVAFRHPGFWQCMDTMRDREYLEEIYESGNAPWVR